MVDPLPSTSRRYSIDAFLDSSWPSTSAAETMSHPAVPIGDVELAMGGDEPMPRKAGTETPSRRP